MRTSPSFALALTTLLVGLALAPTAGAADRQARVHGGDPVDIADVPFQAFVRIAAPSGGFSFCGGSIRDATHVVTAAHCIVENGKAVAPGRLDVTVGTDDFNDAAPPAQRRTVTTITFDKRYHHYTYAYDAAILTLTTALSPYPTSTIAPVAVVEGPTWAGVNNVAGSLLEVSGWGETESGEASSSLQEADVPLVPDADCRARYAAGGMAFQDDVMVCAGNDQVDSCFGDSGGPLTVDGPAAGADPQLAGIVSFGGPECSRSEFPGVYTELDQTTLRTFVDQLTPQAAPQVNAGATLNGSARLGQTVTCTASGLAGATPVEFQFLRTVGEDGAVSVRDRGPSPSYAIRASDAGEQLWCEATGGYAGGNATGFSALSAPVEGGPPPPSVSPPAPQPNPNPGTNAPPPVPPPPTPLPMPAPRPTQPLDRVAPVARVAKASCRRDRCTLDVRVRDAGLSSGVRRIEVRVVSTYRSRCTRGGRRVACTRIRARTLRAAAVAGAAGRFTVRASGLARGRHTFSLRAVDKAGNRQAVAAKRTVRVSGRR